MCTATAAFLSQPQKKKGRAGGDPRETQEFGTEKLESCSHPTSAAHCTKPAWGEMPTACKGDAKF